MKQLEKIKGVKNYCLKDGNLIIKSRDNRIINHTTGESIEVEEKSYLWKKGENLFYDKDDKYYFIRLNPLRIERDYYIDALGIYYGIGDEYIIDKKIGESLYLMSYYRGGKKLWEKETRDTMLKIFYEDMLLFSYSYGARESELEALDKDTGEVLWVHSVAELGEWEDFIGKKKGVVRGPIYRIGDILIVGISSNKLIALDSKTGKLLWFNQYDQEGFDYLVYKGELYTFHKYHCKADYRTGAEERLFPFYLRWDELKEEFGVLLDFRYKIMTDKYIITISQHGCGMLKWDRGSGEIVEKIRRVPPEKAGRHGLVVEGGVLDPIQYEDGKLYVLDSEGVLSIYEIE